MIALKAMPEVTVVDVKKEIKKPKSKKVKLNIGNPKELREQVKFWGWLIIGITTLMSMGLNGLANSQLSEYKIDS